MNNVTVFCFLASYTVAYGLELSRMLGRSKLSRFVMLGFGLAGFVAHTSYLFNRFHQTGLPPLLSSTRDWMLVLAWLLILFYLFLTTMHADLPLGVFALPIVMLLIVSTYFMNNASNHLLDAMRGWKMLHATFLVFGMGGIVGGFISGFMYLVQHHRLKTRHGVQTGWKMPSLERLAQANRWSVMIAFPLLTLGFATGVVLGLYSRRVTTEVSFSDPIVVTSGLLWLMLAGLFIWLLTKRRPTGRQVAWLTISAFGLMLLTLVGLQVISGNHVLRIDSWHARRSGGEHFKADTFHAATTETVFERAPARSTESPRERRGRHG